MANYSGNLDRTGNGRRPEYWTRCRKGLTDQKVIQGKVSPTPDPGPPQRDSI